MSAATLDRAMADLLRTVADQAILPHFRNLGAGQIMQKAANDVVTVADTAAEAMLADGLTRLIPGLPIVGEEAAHAEPAVLDRLAGDCWIVDPLDGTNNFAAGRAPFGIIIALSRGGEAEAGWIFDVLSGRLCVAHRGDGATVDGERITARPTGETPPVAAISTLFSDDAEKTALLAHVIPHYRLVEIPRCAAAQYPRLALGENDVSIFNRSLAWDHAAGALWLNEAGGKAARPDGSPYRVDEAGRRGIIGAASPALWDALAARYALVV